MSLAFLGTLFVINMLTFQNPKVLADMTEDKQNTLAPQTIQALANLPGKVEVSDCSSSQTPTDTAGQLLAKYGKYQRATASLIIRSLTPNANPTLAKRYGITGDGKIALGDGQVFTGGRFGR